MVFDKYLADLNEFDKWTLYGSTKLDKDAKHGKGGPAMHEVVGCLLVPFLVFVAILCIRSFMEHYTSETCMDLMSYCFLIAPFAAGMKAWALRRTGDPKPMFVLAVLATVAWVLGVLAGDYNYHFNMKPFYDVRQLNVYPAVDPSKYGGQSLMDAGVIEFTPGTKLFTRQSMGFKDGDVYCVAPIVANSTKDANTTVVNTDFWAVGINCCSGRVPDFHCGEYTSSKPMKGLRLMDNDKRDMFRLVVKKAEAEYNLKTTHPIFLYWLSDPEAEVRAYQDDGWQYLITASFSFFCVQLFVVGCATGVLSRM